MLYFNKGKMQLERKNKICAMYRKGAVTYPMSKVVWEVLYWRSHWTMLRGRVDLLKLIAIKWRH